MLRGGGKAFVWGLGCCLPAPVKTTAPMSSHSRLSWLMVSTNMSPMDTCGAQAGCLFVRVHVSYVGAWCSVSYIQCIQRLWFVQGNDCYTIHLFNQHLHNKQSSRVSLESSCCTQDRVVCLTGSSEEAVLAARVNAGEIGAMPTCFHACDKAEHRPNRREYRAMVLISGRAGG